MNSILTYCYAGLVFNYFFSCGGFMGSHTPYGNFNKVIEIIKSLVKKQSRKIVKGRKSQRKKQKQNNF